MVSIEEIKNLSVQEKWLIYEALLKDSDLRRKITEDAEEQVIESDPDFDLTAPFNEEKLMGYIKHIDARIASGDAKILSGEEVLSALNRRQNAF